MSNILWKKKFYLCFSKFKCLPTLTLSPPPTDEEENENIPAVHSNNPSPLIKNFNSLYDSNSGSISKSLTSSTDDFFSSSDDSDADSVPDFATVFASQRFFFSSPGCSNSIVESPDAPPPPLESDAVVNGGIAIQTYSPDPYADFRKSMQEMVEARRLTDVKNDWDFLHELFLCYLSLNPKHTHKFIVGAFSDLIVTLVSPAANNAQSQEKEFTIV
ncbi:Transcription repressor OFP12 [Forsythia ovata]|uniref:Transcription repressor n=1 Tax=Forsythia ovata TaxID=205694 RepID=A0ABD1T7Z4_9LAMI